MSGPGNGPEAAAIDAAYTGQIQALYAKLVTNLGDKPVTHETDEDCLKYFTTGLNTAQRARRLALDAIASGVGV